MMTTTQILQNKKYTYIIIIILLTNHIIKMLNINKR